MSTQGHTPDADDDKLLAIAMESIAMTGDPERYRERLQDFVSGLKEGRDLLAGRLIDAWCADKGKQIPWAKAIQIVAIVTKQPDAERDRLLKMDDEDGACGKCGRSDAERDRLRAEKAELVKVLADCANTLWTALGGDNDSANARHDRSSLQAGRESEEAARPPAATRVSPGCRREGTRGQVASSRSLWGRWQDHRRDGRGAA
jgi:hypothetical protein